MTGICRENRRSPITDHRSPITTFFCDLLLCRGGVPFSSIILVSAFSGSLWRDLCIFRWTTGKCRENHRSPITDHRSPITTFFVIYFCVGVVPFFSIILVSAFSGSLPENAGIPPHVAITAAAVAMRGSAGGWARRHPHPHPLPSPITDHR